MKTKLVLLALTGCLVTSASAQVLANGIATINLNFAQPYVGTTPMAMGYHPGFNQYYGGTGGNATFSGMVWDAAGTRLQTLDPIGVDARSYYYNPSTNDIELVTHNALNGLGTAEGLYSMGLDAGGLFTGTNLEVLDDMPGLNGTQTMPAFDAGRNRFYSISTGNTVNVVSRVDGSLSSTIVLDTAAAGNPALQGQFIGYDASFDLLITLGSPQTAYVFELDGSYVGSSQLTNFLPTQGNFNAGYANGQIFVFDSNAALFRGFEILVPEPSTFVLMGIGIALLAVRRRK